MATSNVFVQKKKKRKKKKKRSKKKGGGALLATNPQKIKIKKPKGGATLLPKEGEVIRSTWWTSDIVHNFTKKLPPV